MLRTLVLLRIRCGCLDTKEVLGGIADSVWTFEKQKYFKILMFAAPKCSQIKYMCVTEDI